MGDQNFSVLVFNALEQIVDRILDGEGEAGGGERMVRAPAADLVEHEFHEQRQVALC